MFIIDNNTLLAIKCRTKTYFSILIYNIGREFSDSGFLAIIIVEGGFLLARSFDSRIGQRMEEEKYLTPSVYKKNGFDKDSFFVAWWRGETGYTIENDSDESVRLDFDK